MTFVVRHTANRAADRIYIYELVFVEFLGRSYSAIPEERDDVCISCSDTHGNLNIADILLQVPRENWPKKKTRPTLPLKHWSPPPELIKSENPDLPVVPVSFGQLLCTGNNIDVQRNSMDVGVDFPGTAFFILTGSRRRVRQNWISMIRFAQRNRWRSEQTLSNGQ